MGDIELDQVIDRSKEKASDRKRCEDMKRTIFESNPKIRKLVEAIKQAGCPLQEQHFSCEPCDSVTTAFFHSSLGIVLCQNSISNQKDLETNVVHELVHAYDWCKFKMNGNNIRHLACTEVRAASLSDDCSWYNEIRRGNFAYKKQHQLCARRRAILSVSLSQNCESYAQAEKTVDEIFSSCYKDKQPFSKDWV